MNRACVIVLITVFCCKTMAQQTDSTFVKSSLYAIPAAYFTPETQWAFGVSGAYYFKGRDLKKISSITANAFYTRKKQFLLNVSPKIYFENSDWYVYSNFSLAKYPDFFFGVGNQKSNVKIPYTSEYLNFMIQPQKELRKNFYVGGILSFRYEKTIADLSELSANAYHTSTFGSVQMWDGRDNLFYPTSGIFAKRTGEFAIDNLLSTNAFYRTTIDLRLYRKVIENHIFAAQMCFQGIWGSRLPFQQLATFGGSDVMRGFRRGMFRDNASIALQTEYRLPVYKRLKAGIFVSAGDVLGKHYEKSQLKFAYGAGLRYRLNAAGVHLRADAAKNNYGDPWQFYLTVGEAF